MRILPRPIHMLLAAALLTASPAALSTAGAAEKDAAPPMTQYVDISPIAAPIVLQGRLINYIFVTVRLNLAPGADSAAVRDKEPFFRDALVRAAYRTPFVKPGDYTHINEPALKSVMMVEGARIAGPRTVISVDILKAQAQKVIGLPRPPGPAAPRAPIP